MLRRGYRHDCLSYLHEIAKEQPHLDAINEEAAALLALLGEERDYAPFSAMSHVTCIEEEAYDLVQFLDDGELDRLFVYLAAVEFGQKKPEELDTREYSLFNRVACDLGVDMRDYWKPDQWFLSRRTMAQLRAIIKETGLSRLFGNGANFKKTDLVRMMVSYFGKVRTFKNRKPDQQQAWDWLPEAMSFPAVDPDKQTEKPDEENAAESVQEELAKAA